MFMGRTTNRGSVCTLKLRVALFLLWRSYKRTTKSLQHDWIEPAGLSFVKDKFLVGAQPYFPQLIIILISLGEVLPFIS